MPPLHQSMYLRGLESASIPPFRPHYIKFSKTVSYEINLASQRLHLEVILLSKLGLKGVISIVADSGPLRYVNDPVVVVTFIQI